jgi:hypothetical protein
MRRKPSSFIAGAILMRCFKLHAVRGAVELKALGRLTVEPAQLLNYLEAAGL